MLYKVSVHFHKDFIEIKDDHIDIGITAKPQRGEANAEMIKKIAKYFQVSRSSIKLVAGEKSRNKIIQILG